MTESGDSTEWRDVVGYEGLYKVSSDGRVIGLDRQKRTRWGGFTAVRGRVLKPSTNRDGHLRVGLAKDGEYKLKFVHRIVAEAFIPNPTGKPLVLHWDDVKSNNNIGNLRWGTVSDNWADSVRNGTNRNARKTHCPQGHEYSPSNTRRDSRNRRYCRTCNAEGRLMRLSEMKENPRDGRHGTISGYSYGCRCDQCKEARRKSG